MNKIKLGNVLKYSDLKVGMDVFVEYEKDDAVWFQCMTDGIETICKGIDGKLYTIDKNCTVLSDIEHYIDVGGITIYSFE